MSDKSVCEEFGLMREELENGIQEGKLQYRRGSMHGNPYLKLLRKEVEAYVESICGKEYVQFKIAEKELKDGNREVKPPLN